MITDAELTAMYGRGLHPDTAARVIDEIRRLTAALAGMTAERDTLRGVLMRQGIALATPPPGAPRPCHCRTDGAPEPCGEPSIDGFLCAECVGEHCIEAGALHTLARSADA